MSDQDETEALVLEYDLSAGDLRDWVHVERLAARSNVSRITSTVGMTLCLVGAVAGTVALLVLRQKLVSCVSAPPAPRNAPLHVWIWRCDPGAPSALLWDLTGLVAAVVAAWCVGINAAVKLWSAMPKQQARKWIAMPGAAGRYRDEVAKAGIATVGPDGSRTYLPWSAVTGIRETDQCFFLLGPATQIRRVLPKRGLNDAAMLPRLREFLPAPATPSAQ